MEHWKCAYYISDLGKLLYDSLKTKDQKAFHICALPPNGEIGIEQRKLLLMVVSLRATAQLGQNMKSLLGLFSPYSLLVGRQWRLFPPPGQCRHIAFDYLGPPFDFSNALCERAKILFAS